MLDCSAAPPRDDQAAPASSGRGHVD